MSSWSTQDVEEPVAIGAYAKKAKEKSTKGARGGTTKAPTVDGDFYEIHGRYRVPNYQQGTPPYEFPPAGGNIDYDGTGVPQQNGTVDVCFAKARDINPATARHIDRVLFPKRGDQFGRKIKRREHTFLVRNTALTVAECTRQLFAN